MTDPPPATFDRSVWRVIGDPLLPGSGEGPLVGESVAVKDLFAVQGHAVGAGVPAWLAESPIADRTAPAVQRLLDAGADVRGIARTDQLAYSLAGDNPHYGTPVNPRVPGGLPGGSSSGSATAVSTGAATIGLATDTAGSVRVPASYQGLWGLRTTWGRVPTEGLVPLAPEFDAVGVLTRGPDLLVRAVTALLGADIMPTGVAELVTVPTGVPAFDTWAADLPRVALGDLSTAAEAFRIRQARQAWQAHGAWVTDHPEALRGAVRERFALASVLTEADEVRAAALLAQLRHQFDDVLGDRVLALPAAASPAPRVWEAPESLDRARGATLQLTCLAGITGRPALSAPLLVVEGGPLGVQLIGPRGSDLALVQLASTL